MSEDLCQVRAAQSPLEGKAAPEISPDRSSLEPADEERWRLARHSLTFSSE